MDVYVFKYITIISHLQNKSIFYITNLIIRRLSKQFYCANKLEVIVYQNID